MRRIIFGALAVLAIVACVPTGAWAQGGGASSTGTIQGRVTDNSGAVLPGVSVTATSPSMIAAQTQVTNENGSYRFPAVPPGVYTVTFELAGFSGIKREGVSISLGFTANLNVEMAVATLQETVTVTGDSPVIDTPPPAFSRTSSSNSSTRSPTPVTCGRCWPRHLASS